MSKAYRIDMNIDVSKVNPSGGFLMKPAIKEADPKQPDAVVDPRGFKERTGAEVFAFLSVAAITGANPKGSYDQLKNYSRVKNAIVAAEVKGELIANKTDMDIIKGSIRGNPNWPNQDEVFLVLNQIVTQIDAAKEITENPSAVQPK